jgi:septum formation protein
MLILASSSPRRRELLAQAGFSFIVRAAHIPEEPFLNEDPIAYVTRLAREKAETVYRKVCGGDEKSGLPGQPSEILKEEGREEDRMSPESVVVLGADTTVTLDNLILEKPTDTADAARMLRLLSGRSHRVITGVAVVTAHSTEVAAEVTGVRFLTLSDAEIEAYVATGEPMDKAGAYGIQGRAACWIPRVEGCYFNVMGLPLALTANMLAAANAGR